ncbi:MAG: hypothetical protein AAF598_02860 [Bacteroidota bacterium]
MATITVEEALRKGHQQLTYPFWSIIAVGLFLSVNLGLTSKLWWLAALGTLFTFFSAWLWWAFRVIQWKIWAFTHCPHVQELQRRALNEKLIWPEGSRRQRSAFIHKDQAHQLEQLSSKFEADDGLIQVEDDKDIPSELVFYFSKLSISIEWIFGLVLLGFGVYFILRGRWYGYLLALLSPGILRDAFTHTKQGDPQLSISTKGIQLKDQPLILWEHIEQAYTTLPENRDLTKWLLRIELKSGEPVDDFPIYDLNVAPKEIQEFLYLFQQRHRINQQFR